jgi:hypothetical protein
MPARMINIMNSMLVFFLNRVSGRFPVSTKAATLPLPRAKARTSGLSFVEAFGSLPVMHHLIDIQCP